MNRNLLALDIFHFCDQELFLKTPFFCYFYFLNLIFIKASFLNEGQEESSDVDEQFIVFENEVKEKTIHKT